MKNIVLLNKTKAAVISEKIAVADSFWPRFLGLMGRKGLAPGAGLWIRPCSGVHTMWMRFTIDVVALDRSGKVCALWPRLKPWRISPVSNRIGSVIELAAGSIDALGIAVGDHLAAA